MDKSKTFWVDAGVAGGLVLALLLVIGLDKLVSGPAPKSANVIITTNEPPKTSQEARPLRLAVTPTEEDENGKWDDMNKLLNSLGKGYHFDVYPIRELRDGKKLAGYDVLFLTCGKGEPERTFTSNIRDFVGKGGTLYASDWRYEWVAKAFPEFYARNLVGRGKARRQLKADVLDQGLRDILGATVTLNFNLSKWKTAAFAGDKVKVLIEAEYDKEEVDGGGSATAPLLVKFPFQAGNVIFTSFHNERQNSDVETKLLKYLVFSAVTAKTEAHVTQTMIKGGFSPQKSNLLSASSDSSTIEQIYQSKKGGKIRFVLGFEDRGATMTLSVFGPDGSELAKKTGTSTISIDVNNAQPGNYSYTVSARVPYPDFPFTLTVGESE
ncbi:MAG TPA: hypothetical protein VKE98_18455 [Gemmataceae bacterium]|nr:hypothetical protein [Gemmataceae bacterium]